MNIEARNELMEVLAEISRLVPFIRLGQLVGILADRADVPYINAIAEIEDDELLPTARDFLVVMKNLPPEHLAEQIRLHAESESATRVAEPLTASSGTR